MTDGMDRHGHASRTSRLGPIIAVAVVVALGAWLLLRDGDAATTPGEVRPTAADAYVLQDLAASLDYPIYWAGPMHGHTYELTRTTEGNVYVRYVPAGGEVGDPQPDYLTVATYPLENGYARVERAAQESGAPSRRLDNGALALVNERRPSSVYLARPGEGVQVEVYDSSPERARDLVFSGGVQPIR